jgi:hypothetical protein
MMNGKLGGPVRAFFEFERKEDLLKNLYAEHHGRVYDETQITCPSNSFSVHSHKLLIKFLSLRSFPSIPLIPTGE